MPSSDEPCVSVVIPARNEGKRVRGAVASIVGGRSDNFPLQIIVVDDASSDGCCHGLSSLYSWTRDHVRIDVIRLPRWSGIPYARNAGAYAVRADIMFITDANVDFPSCWDLPIREHIRPDRVLCATIADTGSSFRGYGCALLIPSMGTAWLRHPRAYGGYVPISPCTGTVISTNLFRQVGGYDTAMPIYGAAEPEFSVRLWLYGAEIVSLPNLVLRHRFRPMSERWPFLEAIKLVQLQNYLRFGMLYLDQPRLLQMLRYYAAQSPCLFQQAFKTVRAGDTLNRRQLLEKPLLNKFASFVKRFGILDAAGQLAA